MKDCVAFCDWGDGMFENEEQVKKFIEKYEKYYFKGTYNKSNKFGRCGVKSTYVEDEEIIMKELCKGNHNKYVIAWKFGNYRKNKEICINNMFNGYRNIDMGNYIEGVDEQKDCITKIFEEIESKIINGNIEGVREDLEEIYNILLKVAPSYFGMVYIINSMFFLSKGKIPIYDKNVYKAMKALCDNIKPIEVRKLYNPNKIDSDKVIDRLIEYMCMLDEVFGVYKTTKSVNFDRCECVGYISRGLDRALWVYGQLKN